MEQKKALIMVDLQNDFCKGGSLAVPGGDAVISIANQLQPYFDLIIATQDWHPGEHMSFAANHPGLSVGDVVPFNDSTQVLWPIHCVQGTYGAQFHPGLNISKVNKIVQKGIDKTIDSYSAFYDNAHLRSTGLCEYLQNEKITAVYLLGLATDYCVKYSALDAIAHHFEVFVIRDACRGAELKPGDITKAFAEMQAAGVKLIEVNDICEAG